MQAANLSVLFDSCTKVTLKMLAWILLAIALLAGYLLLNFLTGERNGKRGLKLPPLPFTIPILGSIGLLAPGKTENRNKALFDLSTKLGGIFRTRIGRSESYIVTSYDLFREATIDKPMEFISRPSELGQLIETNPRHLGIAEGNGSPAYMAYRKFVLVKLRSLGFGQRSMEDCILDECAALLSEIDKTNNADSQTDLELRDLLCATTGNVIFSVLCSKRYEYHDRKLTDVTRAGTGFIQSTVFAGILVGFPFLAYITPWVSRVRMHHGNLHSFVTELIQERLPTVPAMEEEARDFMDIYLIQRRKEVEAGEEQIFSIDMLAYTLEDLFVGGFETTATTLQWLLLVMLHYTGLQRRIQAEIDEHCLHRTSTVGESTDRDAMITLADMDHLPLTVSTIWEVWRMYPLLPFGVPHAAVQDAKLGAYDIPKDKGILFHIWSIHHDPNLWRQPEKFYPERYMVPENGELGGKLVFKHPDQVVVFSAGRRSCIGEQLARKESFLLFANLLRAFDVEPLSGAPIPELKEKPGIVMYPPEYKSKLTRRSAITSRVSNGTSDNSV